MEGFKMNLEADEVRCGARFRQEYLRLCTACAETTPYDYSDWDQLIAKKKNKTLKLLIGK